MTRLSVSGCVSAMLSLSVLSMAVAARGDMRPSNSQQDLLVEIQNPGKTGLDPGRYKVELQPGTGSTPGVVTVVVFPAPSGQHHRYLGRASGCEPSPMEITSWRHRISSRRDGSIQLELSAVSPRGCRVVATIPAVPGIEGSPIGTAGAPGNKAPGIEGSPIGTAGAPAKPGAGAGTAFGTDREIEQAIVKARQALPTLSCAAGSGHARPQLSSLHSALQDVAQASSPAAAVQPLRRFEAARQALQKVLAADPATAAGANRCGDAERRCDASAAGAIACGIDAGGCLARVACQAGR